MNYKIVLDSCGELPTELQQDERFCRVPIHLRVGAYEIEDDDNFDQAEFLKQVAATEECAKSACPSPERYMEFYQGEEERVYVICLSSHLSGSYNSAVVAQQLYYEQYGNDSNKKIAVIDSESASSGETQIGLLAMELEEQGLAFEEIVQRLEAYRDKMRTFFVLDTLEHLRKNGRLSAVKTMVAQTLSIKPIMTATKGVIIQKSQAIGLKKSLNKMIETMISECPDPDGRRFMITHVNAAERAEYVKSLILKNCRAKEVLIMDTAGVSTLYAGDGGIIVTG